MRSVILQMLQMHALQSSKMTCVRPVIWMQSRRTQNLHLFKALPAAEYGHAKQFANSEQHHYCAKVRRIYLLPLYCAMMRQYYICCMCG